MRHKEIDKRLYITYNKGRILVPTDLNTVYLYRRVNSGFAWHTGQEIKAIVEFRTSRLVRSMPLCL